MGLRGGADRVRRDRARGDRVSRDVDPAALADLQQQQPPRATVAFVDADRVEALPARARWLDGVHGFAVRADDAPDLDGREVVLVRDDGPYWFELRGITVRGLARRAATPSDPAADDPADDGSRRSPVWYDVEPRRVLAWDYGALRVVPDD